MIRYIKQVCTADSGDQKMKELQYFGKEMKASGPQLRTIKWYYGEISV